MGSQAADTTSQKRNSSTPTAVVFSSALSVGVAVRNRPTSSPSRMVSPATQSSNVVDIRFTRQRDFPTGDLAVIAPY
jgi:hypothetical protein